MLKIKLFCAAGMSTSMLVKKMLEAADKKGLDVQIVAYPESQMDKETEWIADCFIRTTTSGISIKSSRANLQA